MKILVTGAAGLVGTAMRRELAAKGYRLRLMDLRPPPDPRPGEEVVIGSIADRAATDRAVAGVDGILHLAGCTTDAAMDAQIEGNVLGASNVFEAARVHGVGRVVFASSHHVVGFYPRRRRIPADVVLRPDSRYGLTKAFGEQLGAFYADKYGLRSLAIRIGFAGDAPGDRRRLGTWVSWRDLAQLVDIGFTHPTLRFAVVYGVSDNARSYFDNAAAFALGYAPEDQAERFAAQVLADNPPEDVAEVGTHVIGGPFAGSEYVGPVARVFDW